MIPDPLSIGILNSRMFRRVVFPCQMSVPRGYLKLSHLIVSFC